MEKIHCVREVIGRPRNVLDTRIYPKGLFVPKKRVEGRRGGADLGVWWTCNEEDAGSRRGLLYLFPIPSL